jgi:hypothetical protein
MKIRLIADENISWRIKKLLSNWEILPVNEFWVKSPCLITKSGVSPKSMNI